MFPGANRSPNVPIIKTYFNNFFYNFTNNKTFGGKHTHAQGQVVYVGQKECVFTIYQQFLHLFS